MAAERRIKASMADDDFDLDIRVKVATRRVDKFVLADTDSCASTCGDECTNSCASTCEGGCTDTCETCGSCTSECAFDETSSGCRDFDLYEDKILFEINQVRADGVARTVQHEQVLRRVEQTPRRQIGE
jgi:hypothetical protein